MTDYISREAFKAEIRRLSTHYLNEWDTLGVLAAADRIPAADVRPVVRGRDVSDQLRRNCDFMCSECGAEAGSVMWGSLDGGNFDFCPNCGADMREES